MAALPVRTDELAWQLVRTTGEILATELPDLGASRARLRDDRCVCAVGSLDWRGAGPSGSLVGQHVRVQSCGAGLGRATRRAPAESGLVLVQAQACLQGAPGNASLSPDLRRAPPWRHGGPVRTERTEPGLYLSRVSAMRRVVRRPLPLHRAHSRPFATNPTTCRGTHCRVRSCTCRSGTLFNREVSFYQRCAEAFAGRDVEVILSVGRHVRIAGRRAVARQFRRASGRAAIEGSRPGERVRQPRRDEQRDRKPGLWRAARHRAASR